jgi:hypothetical protein
MSGGATEVLLKSVAQAIPTYVMGVFRLPNTLCEELTEMIRYFWCGGGGEIVITGKFTGWLKIK